MSVDIAVSVNTAAQIFAALAVEALANALRAVLIRDAGISDIFTDAPDALLTVAAGINSSIDAVGLDLTRLNTCAAPAGFAGVAGARAIVLADPTGTSGLGNLAGPVVVSDRRIVVHDADFAVRATAAAVDASVIDALDVSVGLAVALLDDLPFNVLVLLDIAADLGPGAVGVDETADPRRLRWSAVKVEPASLLETD